MSLDIVIIAVEVARVLRVESEEIKGEYYIYESVQINVNI